MAIRHYDDTPRPANPPREDHPGEDCAIWWETATALDPQGRFTVTEHCKCGAVLGSHQDSVL